MESNDRQPGRVYVSPVLEHFFYPRNVGEIDGADGIGTVGDAECGDFFKVWIKVQGETLAEVKYKIKGCPSAVTACSMMSVLATGRSVDDAYELDDVDISHARGGLPQAKEHCSNHAASALRAAIDDYVFRRRITEGPSNGSSR
jgi:nitrogen fixation protein NifU and related proteins